MRALKILTAAAVALLLSGGGATFAQNVVAACKPVAERTGELGCWILAEPVVGPLTKEQLFWHLDAYPTPETAEAAKGARGTVVHSFGKNWLLSIEAAAWAPPAGAVHVDTVGPLPVPAASSYTATYLEGVFNPGMKSAIHDHPGPEAFYTMTGEACLETPQGVSIGRAGEPTLFVAGGTPMELMATGTDKRQGITLILHDSSMPSGHPVKDWAPKGLCAKK